MSRPSSHIYETLYILRAGLADSDLAGIHQKVDSVIQKFSGSVRTRDDWGVKDLAYPIAKEKTGRFCLVVYNGNSGVVTEIERHFKILPDVFRYLTVAVEPDYDYAKVKKQINLAEEEQKKAREARKRTAGAY